LLTVSKGSVLGQAKVDEIIRRGEGADLARSRGTALTVLCQTRVNHSRVKRKGGLSVCLAPDPGRTWDGESDRRERKEGDKG